MRRAAGTGPTSRPCRRHRDLGRHVRPGSGRARAVSACSRSSRCGLRSRPSSLAPFAWRSLRTLPRAGYAAGIGVGVLLAAAYGLPDGRARAHDGREHRLHHRPLRRLHAAPRARPLRNAGAARALGRRRARRGRAPAPERGSGRLGARERARSRERRVPGIPDHRDGAVRAALRPACADVPADGDVVRRLHGHRASRSASSRCRAGATVWGALLVTGIFAGALGYLIATWVQARTTAARAALVFTLEAPFAALVRRAPRGRGARLGGLARLRRDDGRRSSLAEPAAASDAAPARAPTASPAVDDAVLLALSSAFLFGAMTVLDPRRARDGRWPRPARSSPSSRRSAVTAAVRGWPTASADSPSAWPFLLAGLLRPGSRSSCSRSPSARRARRGPRSGRHGAALLRRDRVRLPRRAARGRRSSSARCSSSRAESCSRASGTRPEHVRLLGLVSRAGGDDRVRGARQPRPLARHARRPTSTPGVAAYRDDADRRPRRDGGVRARSAARRSRRRGARLFAPAGLCYGLSYVCPLRGVLPRPRLGRLAARRDRVALGSDALVARSSGGPSASDARLVAGAALVVAGGVLIGVYR